MKGYNRLCIPTGDQEIDQLTKEIYDQYDGQNIWCGRDDSFLSHPPEVEIHNILRNYFINFHNYKVILDRCFTILEREDKPSWLIVRTCENWVFEIDKMDLSKYKTESNYIVLGEKICENATFPNKGDWIYYLYKNNYPKEDIIILLNIVKQLLILSLIHANLSRNKVEVIEEC